ncbi:MAG TPA: hypothetical protein VGJ22_10495, partial [Anaerolineales bacterium]
MDPKELAGYRWIENGQSAISGDLLDLYQRLDHLFLNWAADEGAAEHLFPPLIPAADLEKIDYFRSFPHLATFPATLESGNENLERFTRQPTANGEV